MLKKTTGQLYFSLMLTVLAPFPLQALEPVTQVINQPSAPLKITTYNAVYREGDRYSTNGIHHAVEYQNVSGRIIEAVQIGLVSFDVWNEYLDRTGGLSLDRLGPNGKDRGTWVTGRYRGFSFLTGVAYVSKVRFYGGEIWEVDLQTIVGELAKIEKDFDATHLTEPVREE